MAGLGRPRGCRTATLLCRRAADFTTGVDGEPVPADGRRSEAVPTVGGSKPDQQRSPTFGVVHQTAVKVVQWPDLQHGEHADI